MKKKQQQNPVKLVILAVIIVAIVAGYYFHLSNKTRNVSAPAKTLTETDEVLLRNLDTDYPPSPKEVVKYYAQITKCFYDGNYSEEQLRELALKSRTMFDDELRDTQTDDEYFNSLRNSIADYSQKNIRISSYSTSSSVDVEYTTTNKGDMASLYCLYNLRSGTTLMSSNHEFILRKDAFGHWKILGWTLVKDT